MGWSDLQAIAALVSAGCAILAVTMTWLIYRKARATDLSSKIEDGDRATRKHADKFIADIKQEQARQGKRMSEVEEGVARIEVAQQSHLTARDLGLVHEKINRVAEAIAANSATTNAMSEQLKTIQRYILRGT